jgi:hypothetical protein
MQIKNKDFRKHSKVFVSKMSFFFYNMHTTYEPSIKEYSSTE